MVLILSLFNLWKTQFWKLGVTLRLLLYSVFVAFDTSSYVWLLLLLLLHPSPIVDDTCCIHFRICISFYYSLLPYLFLHALARFYYTSNLALFCSFHFYCLSFTILQFFFILSFLSFIPNLSLFLPIHFSTTIYLLYYYYSLS